MRHVNIVIGGGGGEVAVTPATGMVVVVVVVLVDVHDRNNVSTRSLWSMVI